MTHAASPADPQGVADGSTPGVPHVRYHPLAGAGRLADPVSDPQELACLLAGDLTIAAGPGK